MAIGLEAYTGEGLLTGAISGSGRLVDALAATAPLELAGAILVPLDGTTRRADALVEVEVDDLFAVVAAPDTMTPVHAVWHPVAIRLGPYRITADLPALPGFDPARALARPSGSFVLFGHVQVRLAGSESSGANEHAFIWVNRYAVDEVESELELGFFFPGARESRTQPAIA